MKTLYRAFDGKTFTVKKECLEYEYAKHIDDVELYGIDYDGHSRRLSTNVTTINTASAIVIKTKFGAAWVNASLLGKHLPNKPGVYARAYPYGWVKWDGTIQELANKKAASYKWASYISYLLTWVEQNKYFTKGGGSPASYDEWLESKRTDKEEEE